VALCVNFFKNLHRGTQRIHRVTQRLLIYLISGWKFDF
jgi:hypothetical protein